jgi:SAM-dependent methyltransferase
MKASMPSAVRERLAIIRGLVDGQAKQSSKPVRILSLACGHCREAADSEALGERRISQWIAFDQDAESLRFIQETYGKHPIIPVHGSIHSLGRHLRDMNSFDLIYACGLYDYLADKSAQRLTRSLFEKLRLGGRLVVGNFLPDQREVGYMDTFMGWHLIYRTLQQLEELAAKIPAAQRRIKVSADDQQSIGYLEITKTKET